MPHTFTARIICLAVLFSASCLLALPEGAAQQPPDSLGTAAANGDGAVGGRGGSASADFDSLIELIQSTVSPDSWEDNGTGEGSIQPMRTNGVYIDVAGSLSFKKPSSPQTLTGVAARRPPGVNQPAEAGRDPRQASPLRYVSLTRLEATIAKRQADKEPLDKAMLTLAGLQRVQYVLAFPETGELVFAGPAGDWQADADGRIVSAQTGTPIVRLDDLLTLWRLQRQTRGAAFGCSIVPRQAALARTQEFLNASAAAPLEPSGRGPWLSGLRESLGEQDVEFFEIAPQTRVARILLLADFHMKIVGMGLADGVPGVESYLDSVELNPDGTAPAMSVLRWWFSLAETNPAALPNGTAYALPDRCVQVLSENELLAVRGQRVHTGQSDELNRRFAKSFTEHYQALSEKYPIYAELERVFELSLALGIVRSQGLTEQLGWSPTLLLSERRLPLPTVRTPPTVESVINHRVIARRHIVAGVSGGVWINVSKREIVAASDSVASKAAKLRAPAAAKSTSSESNIWWWD